MRKGGAWPLAVVVSALVVVPRPAGADHDIFIDPTAVSPPVLRIEAEHRIQFVNRTGKPVHVEFLGDSGRHHVEQVRDQIWAVFHAPGRHPYVVHLTEDHMGELRGVVEVAADPRGRPDPRACVGITVMGVCLER